MQKRLLVLAVLLLQSAFSFAQVSGTVESVNTQMPFSHNFQNLNLDPTPTIGSDSRVQYVQTFPSGVPNAVPSIGLGTAVGFLGADGLSIPGWLNDLTSGISFFCSGIEPTFNVSGSVDVGGYYQVKSVGNSDVEVNYPVEVNVTFPAKNTFACGQTIRINTAYTVLEPQQTKLKVTPPFVNQEIGPIIDNLTFSASMGLRAWVGYGIEFPYPCISDGVPAICYVEECSDVAEFNESISFTASTSLPQLPPLLVFCEDAFGPNANNLSLLNCNDNAATPILTIAQQTLDVYNDVHNSNYTFANFPDEHTVVIGPPDLPNGGPPIPEIEGTFKDVSNTELTYSLLNDGNKLRVNGVKSSISEMSLDVVSLIDFTGYDTSYSLGSGTGSIDIGDIAPTMTVDQTYDFEYEPKVNLQINLGTSMAYSVYKADGTLDHFGTGQIVDLIAGQYIDATLPQGQTAPLSATGSSNLNGSFKSFSKQEYYRSLQLSFGEVKLLNVIDFTLFEEEVVKSKFGEKGIIDHAFNMALPVGFALPDFVLDPENPIIDVSYLQPEDIRNIGGGIRNVVYKVGLTNSGDVTLSNVQSTVDLATAFATAQGMQVKCITSTELTVNPAFNGGTDQNLLTSENTLAIGQTKYLEFILEVIPADSPVLGNGCFGTVNYTIAAAATATSPIGTNIRSDYNECTTQILNADIATSIDLGAEIVSGLNAFTIYGWNKVWFDKPFATSYGNVGSYGDLVFENVSLNNGPVSTIVGDLHVKEKIRLIGDSDMVVDYVQNTSVPIINNSLSSLTATGAISNNSSCVTVVPPVVYTRPVNTSNTMVTVGNNATTVLNPGNYNTITMNTGSILVMKPGVYNIGSWKFSGNNASVKYQSNNSPITIHVDKFQPLGRNNLKFMIDGPGKVSDVKLFSYGNQPSSFVNSTVQGILIAPNSEMDFNTNSKFEGACYASKVNFRNGSLFKGTKYTLPVSVSADCQSQSASVSRITEGLTAVKSSMTVYPNPVNDKLTIVGLKAGVPSTIRLFDMQGRQLKEFTTENETYVIDVQFLNTGIYILSVGDDKQSFKIIKR